MEREKENLRISRRTFLAGMASVYIFPENLFSLFWRLKEYQIKLEPEKRMWRQKVLENDLFGSFKRLTPEERLEDFELYFEIWKACEEKYQIPWFLVWIIHVQETAVSRHPFPDWGVYVGPMQRDPHLFPNHLVAEAAKGFEFLRLLKQRYSPPEKPYFDSDEVLWAASKIKSDAEQIQSENPKLSFEECVLRAQYLYCAQPTAKARIERYKIIKDIFSQNFENH